MLQAIRISMNDSINWIVLSPTVDAAETFAGKILKLNHFEVTQEKKVDDNAIIFDYIIGHKAEVIYPLPERVKTPQAKDGTYHALEQLYKQTNGCATELFELMKNELDCTQLAFCSLKFLQNSILTILEDFYEVK